MTALLPDSIDALLQAMVRIDTINPVASGNPLAEAPLADFLEELARAWGFAARRLPVEGRCDNLLVSFQAEAGRPWLMFESHMDTVAVEGMTINPFGGVIEGGKLFGRGSCDTKGTGAAMLWALKEYARGGVQPHNVAIAFTVDEEYGMAGVRALVREHWRELGFRPRGVIVGEPTRLQPITAHGGCVRWTIEAEGVAAHSSNPANGRSAISDMVKVIHLIEDRYIPSLSAHHPMTGKAQGSINLIRGGSQINIIPDLCSIGIDRRLVPGEQPDGVLPAVQKLLEELKENDPALRLRQRLDFACPPLAPEAAAPLLPLVQGALKKLGLPGEPRGVPYATDAGDLAAAGIATLVLGPGDIAQAHTKAEFIELDQLHQGAEVYLAIMRQG